MSFDYNKWEDELRSKVEAHEFAFDASAWEQMDELLDQGGGTMAPKEETPPAGGRLTAWIFRGLILIIIGALCWWVLNDPNKNTVTLSSFNITTTTENPLHTENAPFKVEVGSTTNPEYRQLPANTTEFVEAAPEATNFLSTEINDSTPIEEEEEQSLPDRSAAYLTFPLKGNMTIPLLPSLLDDKLSAPVLESQKRKRDRRTLYPDVIERY
ncbi:hypothetical protein [Lewinella cohaerens]|uniref:hypothetical protein n=1 Tax=Lewinella cohaerens TaxID=70995 RepID=UPI000362B07C|nr:hypothetical protein [Lewinella cohaerens]